MKRVLTSVILIPLVLYVVLGAPSWVLFAAAALSAVLCYSEFSNLARAYGNGAPGPVGFAFGLLLLLFPAGEGLWLLLLAAGVGLLFSLNSGDLTKALPRASLLLLGVVYTFVPWKCAVLMRAVNPHWLLYGLVLNWIGDIAAFYVGRKLGRHRLAPRISPGKSWEGAAASIAGSLLFGVLYLWRTGLLAPLPAAGLTILANVAGQLGDLAESAIKRGAGTKDSGTLLPGHGGFLDRVDSSLFSLPVVYAFLRLASWPGL